MSGDLAVHQETNVPRAPTMFCELPATRAEQKAGCRAQVQRAASLWYE